MVAIITDVHYRMSLALVRDLGEAGVRVICCESDLLRDQLSAPPLGALSRYCERHVWLSENHYLDSLVNLCLEVGEAYSCRPVLLPVGAATLAAVAAERDRFDAVSCLLIPTTEQLELFNSKDRLAKLATEHSVPTPESFVRDTDEPVDSFVKRLSYPCVIKPICGEKLGLSAAQRYQFADSESEAAAAILRYSDLAGEDPVVQRRLMGGGLGLSVLAKDGKILHSICHRRLREYPISGGPSSCCKTEQRDELSSYAETLVDVSGFSGLAMFEFKEDLEGNPYLLEVNPRIWGTFPLTRVSQSGIPYLWFAYAWNAGNATEPVEIPNPNSPKVCKMVFTATDLISAIGYLRRGKVSTALAAFCDFLNPKVRDGVFEWRDIRPGIAYFRSLFAKEKRR